MEVVAYGVTDKGHHRDHNEDYMLIDEDLGLYIVCDGMGGAAAGEVASQTCATTIKTFIEQYQTQMQDFINEPNPVRREALTQIVKGAINEANRVIFEMSANDPSKKGMGTTVVVFWRLGHHAIAAHVGDSRIYLHRQDHLHQLTEDHSLVAEQLRRGFITEEEAAASNFTNVIMRAVGTREATEADILHLDLAAGDQYILCSDGLSGPVGAEDIGAILAQHGPRLAAEQLVSMANKAGGPDNITALCLYVAKSFKSTSEIPAPLKIDMLKQIPLYSHLNYKELVMVLDITKEEVHAKGSVVIKEDEIGDKFYVILKGKAHVTKRQRELATLNIGAHFGEMCLLDDAPRSATVEVLEDSRLMVTQREALYPLLQREPQLAVKLLWSFCQVLVGRLRSTSAELTGTKQTMERILARSKLPFSSGGLQSISTRQGMGAMGEYGEGDTAVDQKK